jgi:sec-independent protein translocase protein TatA
MNDRKLQVEYNTQLHKIVVSLTHNLKVMISNILIGVVGPWQLILIVVIVLLLFGGKKIPELMKGLGKGVREFKEGLSGEESQKKDTSANEKKE